MRRKIAGPGIDKKVSAVILSWKRPEEVGAIVENLHQYDFIDEIIIAVNKPDDNKKCYRRWLAALGAKNDIIYIQDDDCIVNNLNELFNAYTGKEMLIGLKGTRIMENTGNKSTIVGWGSFFQKEWIDLKSYIDKYGEDELLIRESDRIVTYQIAVGRPHNYQVSDIVDFESADGKMAMWLEEGHYETRAQAIKRAKELYD